MGGLGPAGGTTVYAPRLWEVQTANGSSATTNGHEILASIATGRIGFGTRVRNAPEAPWIRAVEAPEFGFAFPYVNLPQGKPSRKNPQEPVGLVVLNPDLKRALEVASELVADPAARALNFFYSAYLDGLPAPLIRRSRLFQMWDGFWIAPVVESAVLRPGGWLNIFLLALNLKDKAQERTLRPSHAPVADGMRGNLSFSLPPRGWTIQMVSIPAEPQPGFHQASFKTRSGAERAATAVAVGVLTLGTFIYTPGSSGFSLRYETLPPEDVRILDSWESYAFKAADFRFTEAKAAAISDGRGGRIPKDQVLQKFRQYVTPSLIVGVLKDKRQTHEQGCFRLFDEFLFDWLGVRAAETAFIRD